METLQNKKSETISNSIPLYRSKQFLTLWNKIQATSNSGNKAIVTAVSEIIENVRTNGDSSLYRYTKQFDGVRLSTLRVTQADIERAYSDLNSENPALIAALKKAAHSIRRFAELQAAELQNFQVMIAPGVSAGQKIVPVTAAGIYVPGGRYPLISSVLMGAIPARVAGVKKIILATPPTASGTPASGILAAAKIAQVDEVYTIGGAQAIAALAFGTETVPRVDVIAGPGNAYVAEAKRQVYGYVGIDFIAGPTDILILADEKHCTGIGARLIALDMLAQAEHDPNAQARVLVPSEAAGNAINKALQEELAQCKNKNIVTSSLSANAAIIVYSTVSEAISLANTIAPEHFELFCSNAAYISQNLINYGSLFIGQLTPEVLGDYAAGVNHTLPTMGNARFSSGLSVRTFLKSPTFLTCREGTGLAELLETSMIIAEAEGLFAHKHSAQARVMLSKNGEPR